MQTRNPCKPPSTVSCRPTISYEPLFCRERRSARQGGGLCQHIVRGRREGSAPADGVRADLFARPRWQQRSGEGGVYGAVAGLPARTHDARPIIGRHTRESGYPVRAAYRLITTASGILGRPVEPGDDSCVALLTPYKDV